MIYTVIGIYAEDFQRYATSIEAESPEAAEEQAVREAEAELIVAGVIEGDHQCVDQDPVLGW